jgi:hypothetical protein
MKQRMALAVAAAVIGLAPAAWAAGPLVPPNYQTMCTQGVQKLAIGEKVIGTSSANIAAAAADRAKAEKAMQAQDYYSCWESVSAGLKALDAG